jgi:HEPN domain-containing protein
VTNLSLAQSYLLKARSRLKILQVLIDEGAFSDVVREAQEIVELSLKGMLRQVGVEPPKWHDVGGFLLQFGDRFPAFEQDRLRQLAEISTRLRKEREFSFYGDIDFIPTEQYSQEDARRAVAEAHVTVEAAAQIIPTLAADQKPRH